MSPDAQSPVWSRYRVIFAIGIGALFLTVVGAGFMLAYPHHAAGHALGEGHPTQVNPAVIAFASKNHRPPPVGQLPEVPWAGAIPVILIGSFIAKTWQAGKKKRIEDMS